MPKHNRARPADLQSSSTTGEGVLESKVIVETPGKTGYYTENIGGLPLEDSICGLNFEKPSETNWVESLALMAYTGLWVGGVGVESSAWKASRV